MTVYRLYRKQGLPIDVDEAWRFFGNPANLSEITPPWLHFRILSQTPDRLRPGMIISYAIKVPPGLPVRWTTEITHVVEPALFVDEQRAGPYKLWHHQHLFTPVDGGVAMEDIVHYRLPWGPLGRMAHALWVKNQLKEIFDFRYRYLEEKFGTLAASPQSLSA